MTRTKDPSSGSAKPEQRGRRRPPTIDLRATEIASDPAAVSQPAGNRATDNAARAEPQSAEPRIAESSAPDATAREERESAPGNPPPPDGPPTPSGLLAIAWLPKDLPWPLIGAAAGGAAVALVLVFAGNLVWPREQSGAPLAERLARAEQQLRDLTGRPATNVDARGVDELSARIAKLESSAATPRVPDATLANRLAIVEGDLKALAERLGVLNRRSDEIAAIAADARQRADNAATVAQEVQRSARSGPAPVARSEIDALAGRIAALERAEKTLENELARRADEPSSRSLRFALAAASLKSAVERGQPFTAELGAAQALAPDATVLAPLAPFAASGVPTVAMLARELSALIPDLLQAAGVSPGDGSFLERLQSNAQKLVRVRPIDAATGDEPTAIISRIEAAAGRSDLAAAGAELAKLPAPIRAPAQSWIAKAEMRAKAIETGQRLAADALTALGTAR